METHTDLLPYLVKEDVIVFASDGISLGMDIYFPPNTSLESDCFPVAIERTPYDKKSPRFELLARDFVSRGYVLVVQDVRGRGNSGGEFRLIFNTPDEGQDGAETLAWIHKQTWCNGKIATIGGSFSAVNQQAAALHQPKGLKAQVLRDAGTNYYKRMLRYHGAFNVGVALPWILDQAISGHDVQTNDAAKAALIEMRENSSEWASMLPLQPGKSPLSHSPVYERLYFEMMETSDDAAFWQTPTARLEGRWDDYPMDIAVLQISGWFAHHLSGSLDKFREFRSRGMKATRLIIGPWIHSREMGDRRIEGDCDFGPDAIRYAPFSKLWLDWLDIHLNGQPNHDADDLHYFLMGTGDGCRTHEGKIHHGGEWRTSNHWPLPGTQFEPLFLQKDGSLSQVEPRGVDGCTSFSFDPLNPCLGFGGVNLQSELCPEFALPGPRDQNLYRSKQGDAFHAREADHLSRDDILTFETNCLDADIELTGPIRAHLFVSTTAHDADFVVRLIDVYPPSASFPDGIDLLISEGILRLQYRNDSPRALLVNPGEIYEIDVELGPTSNLFKKGNRIRVEVTCSNYPHYDVNSGTGEVMRDKLNVVNAEQTIFHDATRPSCVVAPIQKCKEHMT